MENEIDRCIHSWRTFIYLEQMKTEKILSIVRILLSPLLSAM